MNRRLTRAWGGLAGWLLLAATLAPALPSGAAEPTRRANGRSAGAPSVSSRMIVSFAHPVDSRTIDRLAAAGVTHAVVFDAIDAVGILAPEASYGVIESWTDVRSIDADHAVVLGMNEAKSDTRVTDVRSGKKPLRRAYSGEGVTMAVVDTGIDTTHPDLAERVVRHVNFDPSWYLDPITDGAYSEHLAEPTGGIDTVGHGTHVAGIAAGTGQSAQGVDLSGVAPGASLVDLRIGGDSVTPQLNVGWELNIITAFQWLIDHRQDPEFPGGIRIATNSYGVAYPDEELNGTEKAVVEIIDKAVSLGIVTVFSAQNEGPAENSIAPGPNRMPRVITVGSSSKATQGGDIAGSSGRGPELEVVAPGRFIWSTRALGAATASDADGPPPGPTDPIATATNLRYYMQRSGTSMAAPHVAGIVALMLEAAPGLTPKGVRAILTSSAVDKGAPGFDTAWGFGLVDARAAVLRAEALAQGNTPRGPR